VPGGRFNRKLGAPIHCLRNLQAKQAHKAAKPNRKRRAQLHRSIDRVWEDYLHEKIASLARACAETTTVTVCDGRHWNILGNKVRAADFRFHQSSFCTKFVSQLLEMLEMQITNIPCKGILVASVFVSVL